MPTMDSYRWEQEVLGEHAEYPGHPIILACMVMDRYPDLDAAERRDPGQNFSNALSDRFIPGAGCAVNAALSTLRHALAHGLEAAYADAERYWQGLEVQHPNNVPRAAHGREQATRAKGRFEERLKSWGTPSDPGSPHRIQALPGL
jgi:hypothetical protein